MTQLRQHRSRQIEERLRPGPAWVGNDWDLVFTTPMGVPLYGTHLTRSFQAMLADTGFPRQRFHDLRRAAASLMLAQGISLTDTKRVLGDSSIAVTNDTYGHITVDATRAATTRVETLLMEHS